MRKVVKEVSRELQIATLNCYIERTFQFFFTGKPVSAKSSSCEAKQSPRIKPVNFSVRPEVEIDDIVWEIDRTSVYMLVIADLTILIRHFEVCRGPSTKCCSSEARFRMQPVIQLLGVPLPDSR